VIILAVFFCGINNSDIYNGEFEMRTFLLIPLLILIITFESNAQVYADREAEPGTVKMTDSAADAEYPYMLPILGAQAVQKGFKLPLSAGISTQYFWQESDLIIENLMVGFNNGPQYNLDEIIRFDDAKSKAQAVTIRPDVWLFPFLNVYIIMGQAKTSTEISAKLMLPDSSNQWQEITSFSTTANFDATTTGFGITPTMGLWGWWMALDMNFTWNDISALDEPAFGFVFGPRFGKTFKIDEEKNVSIWFGGFRVKLAAETNGSLSLEDLFDTEDIQVKLDQGYQKLDEASQNIETWWDGLSATEQRNPANKAKYEAANRTLETAGNLLNVVDGAVNNAEGSTVQYSLEKRPKDPWNFIVGSQFQLNEHLMLRVEYGFLGSRNHFITGIQYRFGL
jgi:hypothetical protein